MKRGFITCLLVFGLITLAHGTDDNVGSETQESGSNLIRFLDKNKRGATKITNTDSPSFNHLTASNTAATTNAGFKPSTTSGVQNAPAFKHLYSQQNYQANPFFTYIQIPQAAQIAAQYSIQSNPVAHFLQTPTQLQYVATPTIAQIPQFKYQSFSTANPVISETASATNSQYVTQPQQSVASSVSSSAAASQSKQIQVPLYSDYQSAQPLYYTQQPIFTYFPQTQAANYIYQQPNANYLFKQQQIANIYGTNRLGLYSPTQNTQLTYLIPMVLTQTEQGSTTTSATASNLKSSDKTLSNAQQTPSTNSFSFGTKA